MPSILTNPTTTHPHLAEFEKSVIIEHEARHEVYHREGQLNYAIREYNDALDNSNTVFEIHGCTNPSYDDKRAMFDALKSELSKHAKLQNAESRYTQACAEYNQIVGTKRRAITELEIILKEGGTYLIPAEDNCAMLESTDSSADIPADFDDE